MISAFLTFSHISLKYMEHLSIVTEPREKESVDEYYARIFLESYEKTWSELVFHAKRMDTIITAESSSIKHVVADRLLNREYDVDRVIREIARVLEPGGIVYTTLLSVAPELSSSPGNLWGFTHASAKYLFGKYFHLADMSVKTYGNVLSGRFLMEGKPASQLTLRELSAVDPHFPVVVGVVAIKR